MKRFTLAVFLFVAGIVLIIFHNYPDVLKGIAIFIGLMMIVPASISVISAALSRRAEKQAEASPGAHSRYIGTMVLCIFLIALGIAMILASQLFVSVVVYIFAATLIATGFYQLLMIGIMSRPTALPWYLYVVPALMITGGVLMIFWAPLRDTTVAFLLVAGIAFICSAVNSLLMHVGYMQADKGRRVERESAAKEREKDKASEPEAEAALPQATAAADSDSETTNE